MSGLRHRRPDAGLVLSLGVIERAPLGPVVDVLLLDDDPRLLVDQFAFLGADELVLVDLLGVEGLDVGVVESVVRSLAVLLSAVGSRFGLGH